MRFYSQFKVNIEPKGQGRARAAVRGKHATMYKATADRQFEQTFAAIAHAYRPKDEQRQALLISTPTELVILAVLPRPESLNKVSKRTGQPLSDPARQLHTKKPDIDNIQKAVLDAMKDWWTDDAVVSKVTAQKVTAAFGEAPHYEVIVRAMVASDGDALTIEELANTPF
jgi:Holliday junction resolvase RusA-like endonuclease